MGDMRPLLMDVTRLVGRALAGRLPTGVDRISLAYVERYQAEAQALVRFAGRWVVLNLSDSRRVFQALLSPDAASPWVFRWCVGKSVAFRWQSVPPGTWLFNMGHSGLDDPAYAAQVRRRNLKPVYFLHDLIPITHPEYGRPGEAEKHHRRLETMLSTGAGLILNSQDTRAALEAYAAQKGYALPPYAVAWPAPASLPSPAQTPLLDVPYFVVLGTIEPRKNHWMLLHLWRELVDEMGEAAPRLVVIGQRGWECEQVVDLLERCPALQGFVLERPGCSDAELATWLYHARALLFPSFVEGFGIPLIEALTLDVPVIASQLPVFREIAGDIPDVLDPLDGPGWKRRILEYLQPEGGSAQRARMKGYVPPSWEAHFQKVEAFLEKLDGMPSVLFALGFPRWKHPVVRQCFLGHTVKFVDDAAALPAGAWVVVWGMMQSQAVMPPQATVLRLEDGFLRSVGLGADIVRPLSWVVDRQGIHYDASRPSDLETLLASRVFSEEELARAAQLRARIVSAGITKYNTGAETWQRPPGVARVILVPGQVETDASIVFGAPGIRTNRDLLKAVREANPDAYILYKPHPDVLARLRLEGQGEREAGRLCDEIVGNVDMGQLLMAVDEVQVITSLAGFEALLRGKPVTCYGQPFYSGWGLTRDLVPNPRRTRKLSLDELVAGALMEYPLYLSRDGKRQVSPEEALEELVAWRSRTGGREPWWRGIYRVFLRRIAGVR
jgi:glycosyltransferase involved in cell wall biosynthesis